VEAVYRLCHVTIVAKTEDNMQIPCIQVYLIAKPLINEDVGA
jgi:hypothetical protein